MKEVKLNGHEYAQAQVNIFEDETRQLQSYNTIVMEVTPDGWASCFGLYSRTTIKHIGWFMRELGLSYQLAKDLYLNNKMYNIYSNEYRNGD